MVWFSSYSDLQRNEQDIFFSFYMLGHKIGWIRELKGWDISSAPYTPSYLAPGYEGGKRSQPQRRHRVSEREADCIHSDAHEVCEMHLWGLGNNAPLQAHTGAKPPLQTLWGCCAHSMGALLCNQVALICCVHSLLVLYFHQPRPADLFPGKTLPLMTNINASCYLWGLEATDT